MGRRLNFNKLGRVKMKTRCHKKHGLPSGKPEVPSLSYRVTSDSEWKG